MATKAKNQSLKTFPSIGTLINETMASTKQVLGQLLWWNILSFVAVLGIGLLGGLGLYLLYGTLSTLSGEFGIIFGGVVAVAIIAFMFLSFIPQIGTLLIIANDSKKTTYGFRELFQKSWRKSVPYFAVMLIPLLFVLGGLSLFIIPGILLSLWFSFASYEVVIKNRGVVASLQRSVAIWQTKGNQIFWRLFAMGLIVTIIQQALAALMTTGNDIVDLTFSVLYFVATVLLSFWSVIYSVHMYKTADQIVPENTKANFWIVGIIAALGWAFLIWLIMLAAPYVPAFLETLSQEIQMEYEQELMLNSEEQEFHLDFEDEYTWEN